MEALSLPTYSAGIIGLVPAASATDIFTLTGAAGKIVRPLTLTISGIATAITALEVQIVKRSAADSGGTSTTPTAVKHNTNDGAAAAVVNAYTVNPAGLGAIIGVIRAARVGLSIAAGSLPVTTFAFSPPLGRPQTLLSAVEVLAVNMNGVTVAGNVLDIDITWSEE